jgi:hypothetical protein
VNRESFQLINVAKGSRVNIATKGGKMSDGGENAILIGEKGLSLRGGETICMDADVATAL